MYFMRGRLTFTSHTWIAAKTGYRNRRTALRALHILRQEDWLSWDSRYHQTNIYYLDEIFYLPEFKLFMEELLGRLAYQPQVLFLLRQLGKKNSFPNFHIRNVTLGINKTLEVLALWVKTNKGKGEKGGSPDEPSAYLYLDPPDPRNYDNIWDEYVFNLNKASFVGEDIITS